MDLGLLERTVAVRALAGATPAEVVFDRVERAVRYCYRDSYLGV